MSRFCNRRCLVASVVTAAVLVPWTILCLFPIHTLRDRMDFLSVGMTREQVENQLGPPVLSLQIRSPGKGEVLVWTDQFWQLDIVFGPDRQITRYGCKPSDSAFRRTQRWINSWFK